MKKYYVMVMSIVFCSAVVQAARFTVYNDDPSIPLFVTVTDRAGKVVKANLLSSASITYNTNGWSSFGTLSWRKSLGVDNERNQIGTKNLPLYRLDVKSPGNMLTGSVHISADGSFAKNFSADKVGIPKGGGMSGVHFGRLIAQ